MRNVYIYLVSAAFCMQVNSSCHQPYIKTFGIHYIIVVKFTTKRQDKRFFLKSAYLIAVNSLACTALCHTSDLMWACSVWMVL
jgi:hypothetical protein